MKLQCSVEPIVPRKLVMYQYRTLRVGKGCVAVSGPQFLGQGRAARELQAKKAEIEAKDAANKALLATEAKSQFLARMSHEIRTPLNGMIAVGQLLAETSLTHQQSDLVNTIRCSGETLLALITDILDFSRIEANFQ